MVEFMDLMN